MASTNGERGDLTASVRGQMGAIGDGAPPPALITSEPRVVLTYRGGAAQIIDAREHIQIAYRLPCPSGMRGDLRKASWQDHGQGIWQRQHTAATVASAREILGRYYGAPA